MNYIRTLAFLCLFALISFSSKLYAQMWIPAGTEIMGGTLQSQFGNDVEINGTGTSVIVGAHQLTAGGAPGYAIVYEWLDNTWQEKGSRINGENNNDGFGQSVSMSDDGNTIAVGANQNDGNGSGSGQVYIYEWNDTDWILKGPSILGESSFDQSGGAIALNADGTTIIIGAIGNDDAGPFSGHARVFEWNDSEWIQKGSDLQSGFGEFLGGAVSISDDGNIVAVSGNGAPNNTGKGVTRIYEYRDSEWQQMGMDIFGDAEDDNMGYALQLNASGNIVAIGAPIIIGPLNSVPGYTKIYEWDDSSWTQMGATLMGAPEGDNFGAALSIDANGHRVAIGALGNDFNGNNAGKLTVFDWDGTHWTPEGNEILGSQAGENLGAAVSISRDGQFLITGAPRYDGIESNEGIAYVFQYEGPSNISTLSDLQIDGTSIQEFDPEIYNYIYGVPGGTATPPQITSVTTSDDNASTSITQASTIPGEASVNVTAEDGATMQSYTISFYFDSPSNAAPAPTDEEMNVISLFSDVYTDEEVDTWNTEWSDATFEDVMIDGNPTKKYTNLGFNGIETVNVPVNASDMMYFHMDIWSPNMTEVKIKLVDFLGDGFGGASGDTEAELSFPVTQGEWSSLKISLSEFSAAGMTSFSDLNQYIISSVPFGSGIAFIDNVYFSRIVSDTDDLGNTNKIKIYPNPIGAGSILHLSETVQKIELLTLQGQFVKITSGSAIDLSDIPKGVYLIKTMISERKEEVTRIVIN